MNPKQQSNIMGAITALFLTCAFVVFGFVVCAGLPQVTSWAAKGNISAEASPFTFDELVECAMATREYTLGNNDADELAAELAEINTEAETKYAGLSASEVLELIQSGNVTQADEVYLHSQEALEHLDDVNALVSKVMFPILAIGLMAAFCLMGTFWTYGAKPISRALLISGVATFVIFGALGIWGALGFTQFFEVFHSVFFAEGSWQFPADSLLITIYPESFWIQMALIWAATSCTFALVAIIAGGVMCHVGKKHEAARKMAKAQAGGASA